jgi:3'-phosphoadenosine 5'-phosphosulfate sulfotransferase (PAPS reductase)/FAD synthetase
MRSSKKTTSPKQQGPGLWDTDGSVICPALPSEGEQYLFVDPTRGILIPRVEYYYRPSAFVDPTQYRGRALRSQSAALLLAGMTAFHYALAFVLYSGGNDSSMATHFAARFLGKNAASLPMSGEELPYWVLHLDTGTGIPENIAHVQSTARQYGYPLEVYRTDARYEDLVQAYGFPGPGAHGLMYALLKKRPLRLAIAEHTYSERARIAWFIETLKAYCRLLGVKEAGIDAFIRDRDLQEKEVLTLYQNILANYPGNFFQQLLLLEIFKRENEFFRQEQEKKILLITGVRSRESRRRMGIMKPFAHEGRLVWLAPFLDWDGNNVLDYLEGVGMRINPVEPKLHRSGDCNCGSFASPGEREDLIFWFPEMGVRIEALEERARAAGFPWCWGEGPPEGYRLHHKGQQYLPGLEPEEAGKAYMCSTCEIRRQLLERQPRQNRRDVPGAGT